MLELILIGLLGFLILTFFYKQAICEFRINQLDWDKRTQLTGIMAENIPTVLRGVPVAPFWTQQDVAMRQSYGAAKIFDDQGLAEWMASTTPDTICPWTLAHAAEAAAAAGLSTWSQRWLNSAILTVLTAYWLSPTYRCWAGARGLAKTTAPWTAIFTTEGTATVTIMPENVAHALPKPWSGLFPGDLTIYDTPFVADLKYMDIVVRPGTVLLMPAHWFISWKGDGTVCPMVCTVEYHSPVSRFACALGQGALA